MVKSGMLTERIIVDAKTGSSGSGAKAAANTHHPQRSNSFTPINLFSTSMCRKSNSISVKLVIFTTISFFMTHSLPVPRGIFASCYLETDVNVTNEDLIHLFKHFYEDAFFVRLVKGSPDINWVKNTNFCDISIHSNGKQVVIFSAIDNLVKGAAGQAVQK